MKVHIELDPADPNDQEILELVLFRMQRQVTEPETAPPGTVITMELEAGRDALAGHMLSWQNGRGFRGFQSGPEETRANVGVYVAACGSLVRAYEAIASGTAGLSPARTATIAAEARCFAAELVAFADAETIAIPDYWRKYEP